MRRPHPRMPAPPLPHSPGPSIPSEPPGDLHRTQATECRSHVPPRGIPRHQSCAAWSLSRSCLPLLRPDTRRSLDAWTPRTGEKPARAPLLRPAPSPAPPAPSSSVSRPPCSGQLRLPLPSPRRDHESLSAHRCRLADSPAEETHILPVHLNVGIGQSVQGWKGRVSPRACISPL
jgi:hypothetical protein